jgi:glyoxylase-like metal-dependent hydrolase (beta-lactamase superfamily II)
MNDSETSLELITYRRGLLDSNCYLIYDREHNRAVVIDPGLKDMNGAEEFIDSRGCILDYIILTHEHIDHIIGVNRLKEKYHSKIICSAAASRGIISPMLNLSNFLCEGKYICAPADITPELKDDYTFKWYGSNITILGTPGHSRGSICVLVNGWLFSGDTILPGVETVTRLPGGNRNDLRKSLEKLAGILDKIREMYPGHGDRIMLENEEGRLSGIAFA